jgi:aspartate/methionine/tyrosine aminotransferase
VQVIPGSFFGSPGHVRLSYGLPPSDLAAALSALGRALDDLSS